MQSRAFGSGAEGVSLVVGGALDGEATVGVGVLDSSSTGPVSVGRRSEAGGSDRAVGAGSGDLAATRAAAVRVAPTAAVTT